LLAETPGSSSAAYATCYFGFGMLADVPISRMASSTRTDCVVFRLWSLTRKPRRPWLQEEAPRRSQPGCMLSPRTPPDSLSETGAGVGHIHKPMHSTENENDRGEQQQRRRRPREGNNGGCGDRSDHREHVTSWRGASLTVKGTGTYVLLGQNGLVGLRSTYRQHLKHTVWCPCKHPPWENFQHAA